MSPCNGDVTNQMLTTGDDAQADVTNQILSAGGDAKADGKNGDDRTLQASTGDVCGRSKRVRKPKLVWSPQKVGSGLRHKRQTSDKRTACIAAADSNMNSCTLPADLNADSVTSRDSEGLPDAVSNGSASVDDDAAHLQSDCDVLRELRTHVRAFHSHLRLLARDHHLEMKCKIYLAAMKCMQA